MTHNRDEIVQPHREKEVGPALIPGPTQFLLLVSEGQAGVG